MAWKSIWFTLRHVLGRTLYSNIICIIGIANMVHVIVLICSPIYIHICSILIATNVHIPNTYLTWSRMNCLEDGAWCSEDPDWHLWMCAQIIQEFDKFLYLCLFLWQTLLTNSRDRSYGLLSTILSNHRHSFHATWKILCTLIPRPTRAAEHPSVLTISCNS